MNADISSFTMANGLTVVCMPKPESLNVSISLRVMAGSLYEAENEIGVAHFLEHIVFYGTEKYPDEKQLAELIDERGGYRNGITNRETVEYVARVLKEDSEVAFEYISQIVCFPLVRDADVIKQQKIIEQEIYRIKSDPEKYAQRLIYSVIFPNTRLEILNTGEVDDLKKITRSVILDYLKKTHTASNSVLVVCGNISKETIVKFAEEYFGKMNSGKKTSPVVIETAAQNKPLLCSRPELKQSILAVGYSGLKIDDQNRHAADLLSVILTRGKSSRLQQEIREKRAMAYVVNSSNFSGRNFGAFTVQVGLANDKISECGEIILRELSLLCTDFVSDDELKKAYAFIKAGLAFSFENSLSEASYYSGSWCSTGMIRNIDDEIRNYELVTKEEIRNAAGAIFSANAAILTIEPELKGI